MVWILLGCAAYLLFFLYDLSGMIGRLRIFRFGFFAGCLLLAATTAGLLYDGRCSFTSRLANCLGAVITGGVLALLFLILLIYTLFFALPFSDTYTQEKKAKTDKSPILCRTGVYALCRHPGVLWLAGFYCGLWVMVGTVDMLAAFVLFSLLDVAYAFFQDRWTFMKLFAEYGDYRREAPFLLPNPASMRRCLHTFIGKEGPTA